MRIYKLLYVTVALGALSACSGTMDQRPQRCEIWDPIHNVWLEDIGCNQDGGNNSKHKPGKPVKPPVRPEPPCIGDCGPVDPPDCEGDDCGPEEPPVDPGCENDCGIPPEDPNDPYVYDGGARPGRPGEVPTGTVSNPRGFIH